MQDHSIIRRRIQETGMTIQEAEDYFKKRIAELKAMCSEGTPWVFLCGTAMIDYLSRLADSENGNAKRFKDFVGRYMPEGYRTFKYQSGKEDLPTQLYHVLRCGIVHSFSLIPDSIAKKYGGRDRSILLSHKVCHLSSHAIDKASDACALNANNFICDIEFSMNELFAKANSDPQLAKNMTEWLVKHPPIARQVQEPPLAPPCS